jgi:hypothetical protein
LHPKSTEARLFKKVHKLNSTRTLRAAFILLEQAVAHLRQPEVPSRTLEFSKVLRPQRMGCPHLFYAFSVSTFLTIGSGSVCVLYGGKKWSGRSIRELI